MPLPPAIINLLQGLGLAQQPQPPQAMTRVTRLPIYFKSDPNPNVQAQYSPLSKSIEVNQDRIPQKNPDLKNLHSVLAHEKVHAMLAGPMGDALPSLTSMRILKYLWDNPKQAQAMKADLSPLGVPSDPLSLAEEAPAYGAQGYTYGNPKAIQGYINAMTPAEKSQYLKILDTGGMNFPKVGDKAPDLVGQTE